MHRRAFLGMTAAASMRVTGANNRVRAGLIGSGLRSQYLTGKFVEFGAEVAAVCDVYQPNLAAAWRGPKRRAMPHFGPGYAPRYTA